MLNINLSGFWIDVGADGAASDGQIYNECELNELLQKNTIGFPDPEPLPGDDRNMPYFFVADNAFQLRSYMMKPFPFRNIKSKCMELNIIITLPSHPNVLACACHAVVFPHLSL